MRGDANIDFIISIVLFIGFVAFILSAMNNLVRTELPEHRNLEYLDYLVSGRLMDKLAYSGLANVLDQAKLGSIDNCSDIDLGLDAGFYYEVNTKAGLWSCNPGLNFTKSTHYIQRPVYVRLESGLETPGIMRVWTWGKAM